MDCRREVVTAPQLTPQPSWSHGPSCRAGNSYFDVAETNERLQAVLKKLDSAYGSVDSSAYKSVSQTELKSFFSTFSDSDLEKLCERYFLP
jgi:hypothetical protein